MKLSGFSIVRNAETLDYPFLESLHSILPLCDELVVAVGRSEDQTRERIVALDNPKIKLIDTVWDDNNRVGGAELARQTNIALSHITGDWGFYIQADEVLHEQYYDTIRASLKKAHTNPKALGLVFDYVHFYGSYNYVGDSPKWYSKEVRLVRNDPRVRSYKDAQGFRMEDTHKIPSLHSGAAMYHYGWVRRPDAQDKKKLMMGKLWHNDEWLEKNVVHAAPFDYDLLEQLKPFEGTHPAVMQERLAQMNWDFVYNEEERKNEKLKHRLKRWVEKYTGIRPGEFTNYKLL